MSVEDYEECEKLFCGSWTFLREKDENLEEFMAAAGESSDKVMHDFPREGWYWTGDGVEDYERCEKLFCGSWTFLQEKDENLEKFMTAAGMCNDIKAFYRQMKGYDVIRDGKIIFDQFQVAGAVYKIPMIINEESEWKDNDDNPVLHNKYKAAYNNGVWIADIMPQNESVGGKKYIMKCYIKDDQMISEHTLADVRGPTCTRFARKL